MKLLAAMAARSFAFKVRSSVRRIQVFSYTLPFSRRKERFLNNFSPDFRKHSPKNRKERTCVNSSINHMISSY